MGGLSARRSGRSMTASGEIKWGGGGIFLKELQAGTGLLRKGI